jgi:hypothetical protein
MRAFITSFILLAGLLCGCSSEHLKAGRGDAGQFILQQALICGAHPATTNGLPLIDGHWRYSVDKYGMIVQLSPDRFSDVRVFLRQAFGSPEQEPIETKDGKLGWYTARTTGAAIQFSYDSKCTEVIVLRSQPLSKIYEGIGASKEAN